ILQVGDTRHADDADDQLSPGIRQDPFDSCGHENSPRFLVGTAISGALARSAHTPLSHRGYKQQWPVVPPALHASLRAWSTDWKSPHEIPTMDNLRDRREGCGSSKQTSCYQKTAPLEYF